MTMYIEGKMMLVFYPKTVKNLSKVAEVGFVYFIYLLSLPLLICLVLGYYLKSALYKYFH